MREAFFVPHFVAGPPVNFCYFLSRPLEIPPLISVKVRYFHFRQDTNRERGNRALVTVQFLRLWNAFKSSVCEASQKLVLTKALLLKH